MEVCESLPDAMNQCNKQLFVNLLKHMSSKVEICVAIFDLTMFGIKVDPYLRLKLLLILLAAKL